MNERITDNYYISQNLHHMPICVAAPHSPHSPLLTRGRNHLNGQLHPRTRLLDLLHAARGGHRFAGIDGRILPQYLSESDAVIERFERQQYVGRGLLKVGTSGELEGVDGLHGRLGVEQDDVHEVWFGLGRG